MPREPKLYAWYYALYDDVDHQVDDWAIVEPGKWDLTIDDLTEYWGCNGFIVVHQAGDPNPQSKADCAAMIWLARNKFTLDIEDLDSTAWREIINEIL
jgi:hypothetical protein